MYGLGACFAAADAAKNHHGVSTIGFADPYVITAKSMCLIFPTVLEPVQRASF